MYDRRNYVGKYSSEEVQQLKSLKEKHGNDWATIGAAMGRSASSVKDRFRLMRDHCHSGMSKVRLICPQSGWGVTHFLLLEETVNVQTRLLHVLIQRPCAWPLERTLLGLLGAQGTIIFSFVNLVHTILGPSWAI